MSLLQYISNPNQKDDEVIVKVVSYANSGVKRTWYSESELMFGPGDFMWLDITVNLGEVVRFSITGLFKSNGSVWLGLADWTSGSPGITMDPRFYHIASGQYELISLEGIIDNIPPGERALRIRMSLVLGSYATMGYGAGYPTALIIQTLIM